MLLLLGGLTAASLSAQSGTAPTNGEVEPLVQAQRSVENQVIVQEIEDAGFELDVEEGFDEEWEEDIWIASEADDVAANYVDPSEGDKYDVQDIPAAEEIAAGWSEEAWENPESIVEESEEALVAEEDATILEGAVAMRGDAEAETESEEALAEEEGDIYADIAEEEEAEEANWWEDDANNWSALVEDVELDEFDMEYEEEEDLDLLEELYGIN